MPIDGQGGRGRPITSGTPSQDKEKKLLAGQGVLTSRTLSASRYSHDGQLTPLLSPSPRLDNNNNNILRCLSLSPVPSLRMPVLVMPGYGGSGSGSGRGAVTTTTTIEKNTSSSRVGAAAAAMRASLLSTWRRNEGPFLVCLAQFFGAFMSAVTRFLELDEETGPMHPMLILFWRMSATTILSGLWIYYTQRGKISSSSSRPRGAGTSSGSGSGSHEDDDGDGDSGGGWRDILLGTPDVRSLLLLRGVAGFVGLYGLWYSMIYLPLAEAVVISFLAPTLAGYLGHIFLHERFTRREQLASFLALAGVVLIARPISLFAGTPMAEDPSAGVGIGSSNNGTSSSSSAAAAGGGGSSTTTDPGPAERLVAVVAALLGVIGGAVVITTLRRIGTRAHALVSVNYFSACCVAVTMAALALGPALDLDQPLMRFALPATWRQVGLLLLIGVCGFVTQFLMTTGLAVASSSSSSSHSSSNDDDDEEEAGGGEGEYISERRRRKRRVRKGSSSTTGANRATAMIYTNMLFSASFDLWLFGNRMGWVTIVGCALIVGSALWVVVTKDGDDEEGEEHGGGEPGRPQMQAYNIAVAEEGVVLLESYE